MKKENKKPKALSVQDEMSSFLLYTTPEGNVKVEAILSNETVWLSQEQMAQIFGVQKAAISKHLKNAFESGELEQNSVVSKMETTASDGKKYQVMYYNLDAIISVGYRVNSARATQFRIWATNTLREFIIKGFVMDDERLKNGRYFGKDYFEELLERVRSIRASERRVYQKITDIFAECSADYDKNSQTAHDFYAAIQNKFHFAITGLTAAEIIYRNADAKKEFMGLKTWEHAPKGRILKRDAMVAKNYLTESQIQQLERLINAFFDYIELQIERRNAFTMEEFANSVAKFLDFNDYKVLSNKGSISSLQANCKAGEEYDQFNKRQQIESDFDQIVKKLEEEKGKEDK
jgi:hypothetical protein